MSARPLADLLPAVTGVLGVLPGPEHGRWLSDALARAGLPDQPRHAIVLLIDGLGDQQLAAHTDLLPALSGMADLGPLAAPFPSSTAISLTSLGTGLPPGMHGIVGSTFRLEDGTTLNPLQWGAEPNPIATQPEPTLFERAAAAGAMVVTAGSTAHRNSGLTRAALRGGAYPGTDNPYHQVGVAHVTIELARRESRPSLTYAYWPSLDKAGHVHGVDSEPYRKELARVDTMVESMARLTGPDVLLLVTADHGMIDVPDDRRIDLEARPSLRVGVDTILGEPRVRHVYTKPGCAAQVRDTWAAELAGRAQVMTREEVAGLLGPVDEWNADRIGDVVAIAQDDWALVSDRVDHRVSSLRGQHGGLTDAEVLVPLRVAGG